MVAPVDTGAVLALRAQILARSTTLGTAVQAAAVAPAQAEPLPFASAMHDALRAASALQNDAGTATDAYERGDSHDLASVMIARQKASIAFEATLQVRNRLLGAYRDVMSMPL